MTKPPLPTLFDTQVTTRFEFVPTAQIMPGKKKLIKSVARVGVLQSILLVPIKDQNSPYRYEIIEGEGRHYSAVLAEINHIPALIAENATRNQAMAMRTIANMDRGPNIVAEARAIKHVLDSGKYATLKDAAEDMEIDLNTVKKRMRLMELPAAVLDGVFEERISPNVLENMANLSKEYRSRAVKHYLDVTKEEKGRFTASDLKSVTVKRQDDLGDVMMDVLKDLPAALPLLHLSPAQLMAEEIREQCSFRKIDLADVIAMLKVHLPPEVPQTTEATQASEQSAAPEASSDDVVSLIEMQTPEFTVSTDAPAPTQEAEPIQESGMAAEQEVSGPNLNPERTAINPGADEAEIREHEREERPETHTPQGERPTAPQVQPTEHTHRINTNTQEDTVVRPKRTNLNIR